MTDITAGLRSAWGMEPPRFYAATPVTRSLESIAAKNGLSVDEVRALNPGLLYPVNVGVRVRVR